MTAAVRLSGWLLNSRPPEGVTIQKRQLYLLLVKIKSPTRKWSNWLKQRNGFLVWTYLTMSMCVSVTTTQRVCSIRV